MPILKELRRKDPKVREFQSFKEGKVRNIWQWN